MQTPDRILVVDSHHGIYCPKIFSEMFKEDLTPDVVAELANPDNEFYWEVWDETLDGFSITLEGVDYVAEQDEDVWLVPRDRVQDDY